MRNLEKAIGHHRYKGDDVMEAFGTFGDEYNGVFFIPYKFLILKIIAARGDGWEHVSVSIYKPDSDRFRTPSWEEMDFVKRLVFKLNEVAMQLHVAEKDHINEHPYVLHLWRPINKEIPLPPKTMV